MDDTPSNVGQAPSDGAEPDPQGVSVPKKKRRASPTQRSIWELRKRKAMVAVVERRLPMPGYITRDLWGCIDILAVDDQPGVLGIQATTVNNQGARLQKIRQEPRAARFVRAGNRLELWAWSQKWGHDARQRPRRLWQLTVTRYDPTTPTGEKG